MHIIYIYIYTYHISYIIYHISYIIYHISYHISCILYHISYIIYHISYHIILCMRWSVPDFFGLSRFIPPFFGEKPLPYLPCFGRSANWNDSNNQLFGAPVCWKTWISPQHRYVFKVKKAIFINENDL